MFETKNTRTYPPEFTVASPTSDFSATFHGVAAKARADEYAAFLNTPAPEQEPTPEAK
jgi:hypothetical protein